MNMHKIEITIVKFHELSILVKTQMLKSLCLLFGGASAIDQTGVWMDEQGKLVSDDSWLIYTYATEFNRGTVVDLVRSACICLEQDCIMLVIDNDVCFIGKD